MIKKLLLLASRLPLFSLYSQDIIVTKDSKKIEAVIIEITPIEIKYKKFNNTDGPTFVSNVSEINTIIYSNGETQIFNNKSTETKTFESHKIDQVGSNRYRYHEKYISKYEYANVLREECPIAYAMYTKGRKQQKFGNALMWTGIGFAIGGCVYAGVVYSLNEWEDWDFDYGWEEEHNHYSYTGAYILGGIGAAAFITSLPIKSMGKKNVNNALDYYNRDCSNRTSLNLNINSNGFGLALVF